MKEKTSTVDKDEVERFSRIAGEWWNPEGKFKPLHRINPLRIQWILDQVERDTWNVIRGLFLHVPRSTYHVPPLHGFAVLDIGCGGGLIAEPMARLGAKVTAIDASEKNIAVAKLHAQRSGLEIDYRCTAVESLVASPQSIAETNDYGLATNDSYDIILALEIIEHVADVEAFVAASCALLKPGGLIIYSTLNRTAKSFALAVVGAEYVLRWLPIGTHDWNKFLRPSELCAHLRHNNIEVTEMTGMVMSPLTGEWRLDAGDLSVNYLVAGTR